MKIARAFGRATGLKGLINGLADFGIFLPLTLTQRNSSAVVRVAGLFACAVWIIPAALVCGLPLLLLICIDLVADVARGEL